MSIEFEIHLGHGWYMDHTGQLHQRPDPRAPTYELLGGLPFDPEKVGKVLSDLAKAMPNKDDPASMAKFRKLGVPEETIKLLAALGTVASVASTVVAVYAAFFAVAYALGVFKEGPSAIELQIKAATEELRSFSRAISDEMRNKFIADLQADITLALNTVKSFLEELKAYKPDPDRLEARLQDLRAVELRAAAAALKATNTLNWMQGFDRDEYPWWWIDNLHWQPENSPSPVPIDIWPQGKLRFDHRLAMPFALYTVQAYLTVIKGITPEYRTTGEFRHNLRELARQTSILATNMRAQGLARTIHTPMEFIFPQGVNPRPGMTTGFWGHLFPPDYSPTNYIIFFYYSVGAVDLAAYTDAFLRRPEVSEEERDNAVSGKASIKRGQLEMLWAPGMPYEPGKTLGTEEENAAEANALSEKAYMELLASSGYLQLVHQATLLRHLSTEPDRSETVAEKKMFYVSFPDAEESVTVRSDYIPYSAWITAMARKKTQQFRAHALLTTQPPGRQRAIRYRVLLRSLNIEGDRNYESAYSARYVTDDEDPSYNRLAITFERGLVKDEILLAEGTSPMELLSREDTDKLKADTFDWYIPQYQERYEGLLGRLASMGGREDVAPPPEVSGSAPVELGILVEPYVRSDIVLDIVGGKKTSSDVEGERRNLREEICTVRWSLRWQADRLLVTVEGRPQDRNCMLYLVVEEQLISRQWLHTAFPVPLNTQLTFVPSWFFVEEKEAWERSVAITGKIARLLKEAADAGIIEPGSIDLQPREFVSQFGLAALASRYNRDVPKLVQSVLANYPGAKMPEEVSQTTDECNVATSSHAAARNRNESTKNQVSLSSYAPGTDT